MGRVLVGEHEAYRTIRAYTTPRETVRATQQLVGDSPSARSGAEESVEPADSPDPAARN